MKKRYILKSPRTIAGLSRVFAKLIDIFIILILCAVSYPLGILMAAIYISTSDALFMGQSVGKKSMGFAVVSLVDGSPCSIKQSFVRNLPLFIPIVLLIIPVWGWFLSFILGIPMMLLELYLLFKVESGHRLGDVMADTTVIANDQHREDIKKKNQGWFNPGQEVPS